MPNFPAVQELHKVFNLPTSISDMDMLVPEQPPIYITAGKQDSLVHSHFVDEDTSPSYVGTCVCSDKTGVHSRHLITSCITIPLELI